MKGKVVVITGASSGIGEATALLLGRHGGQVVIAARRLDRLKKIEEQIRASGGEALVVKTDVTRPADLYLLMQLAVARFGKISALVNNAGVGWLGRFQDMAPEELTYIFKVNVFGSFWATQAALPHLVRDKGVIINVASVAGLVPSAYHAAYSASKAAQLHLANALRLELHGTGVRVTNINPGLTKTDFIRSMHSPAAQRIHFPSNAQEPVEVAQVIVNAIKSAPRQKTLTWTGRLGSLLYKWCPRLYDLVALQYFKKRKVALLAPAEEI